LSQERRDVRGLKEIIRSRALALGFHAVGFAAAGRLEEERGAFERWLEAGRQAGMSYLERGRDARLDPARGEIVAGARTVVSVALGYELASSEADPGVSRWLAGFARGIDYHDAVRERLKQLLDEVHAAEPELRGRAFVDTAPILERAWAVRAGLGSIGRNTCLIHPTLGSALVLGELVLTAEVEPDEPTQDDPCGECRACVEACPGGALLEPDGRVLDARRCLAFWTVEARAPIPEPLEARAALLFGCDACQSACPWNGLRPRLETPLAPLERWRDLSLAEVAAMDEARLEQLLRGTSLARAGAARIRSRARRLLGSSSTA
jgi:epoxyqueuosine reductase